MVLVANLFLFCEIKYFCFVVAICDLVQDLETFLGLCLLLTATGNLF